MTAGEGYEALKELFWCGVSQLMPSSFFNSAKLIRWRPPATHSR